MKTKKRAGIVIGFFDFFKKKPAIQPEAGFPATESQQTVEQILKRETAAIPEEERQYYQPDSYYTAASYSGSHMERAVVPFEHRKKTAVPSKNGLYPAEILLLSYCSAYPNPPNGYPGFWWFEYGIRDIGGALRSLESRGFLRWATAAESLRQLRVPQLKEASVSFGLPASGKKEELIQRLQTLDEAQLTPLISQRTYRLTELGQQELADNEYVEYMHRSKGKTIENGQFGPVFDVWEINRQLSGNMENWQEVIEQQRLKVESSYKQNHEDFIRRLQKTNPAQAAQFIAQDNLLTAIQEAEKKYSGSDEADPLIAFWENLWAKEDLSFLGSRWHFRLADLYIQEKRYGEARSALQKIEKPTYQDKVKGYLQRIEKSESKKRLRNEKIE